MDGLGHWGYHLVVDGRGLNGREQDREAVLQFMDDLVKRIGMVAWGPCYLQFNDVEDPKFRGYSAVQFITTSSITVHFVEEGRSVYLDVFSCKNFDTHDVLAVLQDHFQPEKWTVSWLTRQA